jgi:protein TonB
MVRTQSSTTSSRIDPSRVFALSAAVALHTVAVGLLLIPLSRHFAPQQDASRTEVRWMTPEVIPVTPKPPEAVEVVSKTTPPRSQPALPQLIEAPRLPVFATEAVIPFPSNSTEQILAPDAAPSLPAMQSPQSGAQLRYLQAPAPAYPQEALRAGAEGTVILRVLVDETGKPVDVSIEKSSGNRALDNAARAQVRRHWRFQPAMEAGTATQAIGLVPVTFSLQ